MSQSASESGGSGSKPGEFVPPSVEDLDAVLDAYEFLEILGKGGMGAVYKARQVNLDRLVAIKILPQVDDGDELRFAERFQREAQAMGRLSHPNIIGVYDFGRTRDGQLYIVMEYVEGTDLHQLIRTGELTTDHLFGWFPQICDALQYAHDQGIVHRDIKPANIMISREGVVKVADFGLAKLSGAADGHQTRLTLTNVAMGTPDYVAPEALDGELEPDHRADLYAVGVMLYEMLTGKIPRGSWRPPSILKPGIDPRFDALITRAMDADREGRFQSATEINTELRDIQSGPAPIQVATRSGKKLNISPGTPSASEPIETSHDSEARTSSRSTSIRPKKEKSNTGLIVGISASAALIIGTIGALFLFGGDRDREDEAEELAARIVGSEPMIARPEPEPATVSPPPSEPTPEVAPEPPPVPVEPSLAESSPDSPPSMEPNPASTQSDPDTTNTAPPAPAMEAAIPPRTAPEPEPEAQPMPDPAPEPATSPEVPGDPRLGQLEQGFQAAFEREANGAFLAGIDQLDRSYLGAIERARSAAQQAGNLDEVTALDQEKQRITAGPGVPPADDPGTPPTLMTLRRTYREAFTKLEVERDTKTVPIYEKYLGALVAYEAELTRANEISKALAVREFRTKVETRKASLETANLAEATEPGAQPDMAPAAPSSAPPAPDVEVITSSAYRELATWILSQGGRIEILNDDGRLQLTADNANDLPNGRFTIDVITLGKPRTEVTDDDFTRFVGAPDLTRLSLSECPLTKLPALKIMDKLQNLQISSCPNLTEEFFADVGTRPALEILQLNPIDGESPPLPVESAKAIGASRSLRQIGFRPNPFDDAGLAELARIPTLETLGVEIMGSITGDFLLAFENHPSLANLFLGYVTPEFDGTHLATLAGAGKLRNLNVLVGQLSDDALPAIGSLTQLTQLSFSVFPTADDTDLEHLAPLANLARLEVGALKATGSAFRSFQCGPNLKFLGLPGECSVDDDGLAAIAETFPHLGELTLEGSAFTGEGIAKLGALKELHTLRSRSQSFDDEAFIALGQMPDLQLFVHSVGSSAPDVSTEGLAGLARSPKLNDLHLSRVPITAEGWKELGKMKNLVHLNLVAIPIGPEIEALSSIRTLSGLTIQGHPKEAPRPDEDLIEAFKKLRNLSFLRVGDSTLSDDAEFMRQLREALPGVQVSG